MKFVTLATGLDLTSTTATTAITLTNTPLRPYRKANVKVFPSAATGTTTMLIEGSEDGGSTYSTLQTISVIAGSPAIFAEVKTYPTMRVRNSVAGAGGTANVYMEGV